MTTPVTTWRIVAASLAPARRGDEVVVAYDDRGISLVTHDDPTTLIVPWRGCELRLTRRSTTWELRMRHTPWGAVTLSAFRPLVPDEVIRALESRGVVWTRWRWTTPSAFAVILLGLAYTGMTLYAASQSPLTRVEKIVPGPHDFGFTVRGVTASIPFTTTPYGAGVAFRPSGTNPDIESYLPAARWRHVRREYVTCAGTSITRDPLWGTDRVLPEAQITTFTYQSTTAPDTFAAVTATWIRDSLDMTAIQRQISTRPVVPCYTSAMAHLTSGEDFRTLAPARSVAPQVISTANVSAAVATTRRGHHPYQLYTAVVTSQHAMATVVVLTERGNAGEARFRDVLTFLAQSVAGQRPAAA